MNIRRAEEKDMEQIENLLRQVLMVHHKGRPDLFKGNCMKYSQEELKDLLRDENKPVFVATDQKDAVLGYAFCVLIVHENDNILTDIKTLYLDDLCVNEDNRGQHIGQQLFEFVKAYANKIGCYNLTLNVWACNPGAMKFYESCGLAVQKQGMECVLG